MFSHLSLCIEAKSINHGWPVRIMAATGAPGEFLLARPATECTQQTAGRDCVGGKQTPTKEWE